MFQPPLRCWVAHLALCAVLPAGALAAQATAVSAAPAAAAPSADADAPPVLRPSLELSSEFGHLTQGYGAARTVGVKYTRPLAGGVLDLTATQQRRFDESGHYIGLQLTRDVDERNYVSLALGGGSSVLWPIWRTDLHWHHKWGEQLNYVTGLGYMYASNRNDRNDRGLLLSLTGYFDQLVVEGGLHVNRNNPGQVRAGSQYLAATWGRDQVGTLMLRGETAQEAYQSIGVNQQLVDFDSRNLSIEWRHWWRPGHSLIVGGKVYRNPYYTQTDLRLGVKLDL